ncbi:hypothetical protein OEIGOIKO_00550 [Streptomyces chrestomyceticus JCM 4735]|uniref:Uncharacterized protein n=1 Tax=Streptomyces chrestomyceticus JCM 4735 TaxID=1306181 RepID=A0A7U9KP35_9ACTN|nr:hypothetical protein OEIGOIKO_00550 [Streptomyces chrestomyceticus JCM 4735]
MVAGPGGEQACEVSDWDGIREPSGQRGVARLPVLDIRSGAGRQIPHHGLGAAVLPQLAE